MRRKNQK